MPDYDTKNIPILEDIIEDSDSDSFVPVLQHPENLDTQVSLAENNLDLFTHEPEDTASETVEPGIGPIDDIVEHDTFENDKNEEQYADLEVNEFVALETETGYHTDIEISTQPDDVEDEAEKAESALIDYPKNEERYHTGLNEQISADFYTSEDTSEIAAASFETQNSIHSAVVASTQVSAQETVTTPIESLAAEPIALESIVDDIVKQLLPELEQQLRLVVQQALEDKLPDDILEQLTIKK